MARRGHSWNLYGRACEQEEGSGEEGSPGFGRNGDSGRMLDSPLGSNGVESFLHIFQLADATRHYLFVYLRGPF